MKAMVLTGLRKMELQDLPDPRLERDDEVLLKVEAVGVCGSDIHYYRTGRIGSLVVEFPFVLGHEYAGTVLEAGKAAKDLKPGDHVAVDPSVSCGDCDQCRIGRFHTCRNVKFLGCPGQMIGCLSEFYVMPAKSCYRTPPEMGFDLAMLAEPLSIGCYAVKLAQIPPGAKLGILGLGPIGLSVLAAARAQGHEAIYATEPLEYRRAAAVANGVVFACDPYAVDAAEAIAAREPALLDIVFECCGKQDALDDCCRILKNGGKLMNLGIPESDTITFVPHVIRRKELCIQNVRRQNECVEAALELIENSGIDLRFMLTHEFALADSNTAFELVDNYEDGVIKAMIKP